LEQKAMTKAISLGDVLKSGDIAIHNNLRGPLNKRQRSEMQGEYAYYGATEQMDTINQFRFDGFYVLVAEDGTVYGSNKVSPMVQRVSGKFWVSNHAHVLQCRDTLDTKYLALALEASDVRPNITGAVQLKLSKNNLQKINIYWPDRQTRMSILSIVDPIDNMIELSQKMNERLEELGQALFRNYLIDNLQANDWQKKSLDEIADFLNGLAMQKYPKIDGKPTLPVIKIREMSSGITSNTDMASAGIPEKYVVHDGDLLFSWSGTLIVKFWAEGDGALNQHLFKVSSKDYPEWLYYHWTNFHLEHFIQTAKSKATTMGHIQRKHLSQAKVRIPDSTMMQTIGEQIQPLIDLGKKNSQEIRTLSALRDTLLPRLISGRIKL
jgi:type I restriction enzyme, S subunit